MNPKVAVVIPTHNRSDLLRITLRNVLCQEGVDLQIAVVDDGSTDDTPEVLAKFARDDRFVVARQEPAAGACKARNRGFTMTDAPYVCYLDADDLLHPTKLARQVERLSQRAEADATVCQMAHFEKDPNEATTLWNTFSGATPKLRFLGHDPVWGMHAPLWRRASIERIGALDESLPMAQDYEFHARALLKGISVDLDPRLLSYCRRHSGPAISTSKSIRRLETLLLVFDGFLPRLSDPEERKVLLGNYLWLANYASIRGEGKLMREAFERAEGLLGSRQWPFVKFCALSHLALRTRRHRFYAIAREVAGIFDGPLAAREDWFNRHQIADEPGIKVFPMPGPCWQE